MSRLIQLFLWCYHFYIYGKCQKINTFQSDRCTHAWATIVLLVVIAALSIFQNVKNNDNPFYRDAIVIFCTQEYHYPYQFYRSMKFVQVIFRIDYLYRVVHSFEVKFIVLFPFSLLISTFSVHSFIALKFNVILFFASLVSSFSDKSHIPSVDV